MQTEMTKGTKDRGNMAMRQRAEDLKGLLAGDQIFTFQQATQELDLSGWPGGEIGEGAFVDLGADANGFAEEDGRRGVAIGDGLDVHGSMIQLTIIYYKAHMLPLHGYITTTPKTRICKLFKALRGKWPSNQRELRTRKSQIGHQKRKWGRA